MTLKGERKKVKKLIKIEFVKMRQYWVIWAVMFSALVHSAFMAFKSNYDSYIVELPKIEYALFTYVTARWFSLIVLLSVAFVISEDFHMRTVQNVLVVGISRQKYYWSRLLSQFFFVLVMYAGCCPVYVIGRILYNGSINTSMPPGEFLIVFLIMLLQLLAYASFANMVSVFCKNQVTSIVISLLWIFLAILMRAFSYEGDVPGGIMAYEPLAVMERYGGNFVDRNQVFTFASYQCGISALVIMIVTSIIGYVRFAHSDVGGFS